MKKRKLLITKYNDSLVSLLIDSEGRTVRINAETGNKKSLLGNIYAGNVTDVIKGMNAAFVEFADGQRGFLQLDEKAEPIVLNKRRRSGAIRQGDIIMVQVAGDAIKTKDSVLSMKISIAGKYAVLAVGMKGIKVSTKIENEEFRSAMAELTAGMAGENYGFIIRTAALKADPSYIIRDIENLKKEWKTIREKAVGKKKGLLHGELPFYLSDYIACAAEIDEIVTDDTNCLSNIKRLLNEFYPEDIKNLRAYGSLKVMMKTAYGLKGRIADATGKMVRLKSGAFLVIEPTEALVAIDVNSGKAVKPDFLKINLEAAKEVARQLRLRNLSGLIVVDFISMRSKEDNDKLIQTMKEYLHDDPLKPKAVDMTALGLLEITRKKVRRPLYEILDI